MKTRDIAAAIANSLFLPVQANYKDYFTIPLRIIVILFFVYSCGIAAPPIIDLVISHNLYLPLVSEALDAPIASRIWLAYFGFILEVLFFLMIGGSVFSEWIAAHSKKAITKFETAIEAARHSELKTTRDELTEEIRSYNELLEGINFSNFIPRLFSMYKTSNQILSLVVQDVPKVNARFLATKLAVAFPGGAYGVLAFILFGGLIQIKVALLYLEFGGN